MSFSDMINKAKQAATEAKEKADKAVATASKVASKAEQKAVSDTAKTTSSGKTLKTAEELKSWRENQKKITEGATTSSGKKLKTKAELDASRKAAKQPQNTFPQNFSAKASSAQKETTAAQSTVPQLPKVTTQKTAYQKNMETKTKWYAGDTPTLGEAYSLLRKAKENGQDITAAQAQLTAEISDPTSVFYRPYMSGPTNKTYIDGLAALGVDTSTIDDAFFENNAYLKQYYILSDVTGSPTKPNSKSSDAEWAAYYYYQLAQDEEKTKKVESEWDALQDEITYWANRTDRNYSDDEILAKIDWSKYSTLTELDEDAKAGTPTRLNRATSYSKDDLKGVIWAARNGKSTGSYVLDTMQAVDGQGTNYVKDDNLTSRRDATSANYNPYVTGSTLDDAALYFNRDSFDAAWIEENRGILNSNDATEVKMYQSVLTAEETTEKAEEELEELNEWVEKKLAEPNADPDSIIKRIEDRVADQYPTLYSMQKSLKNGKIVSTTRAVNYSLTDIGNYVRSELQKKQEAEAKADEEVAHIDEVIGGTVGTGADNGVSANDPTVNPSASSEPKIAQQQGNGTQTVMPTNTATKTNVSTPVPTVTPIPQGNTTPVATATQTPTQVGTPAPTVTPVPQDTAVPTPTPTSQNPAAARTAVSTVQAQGSDVEKRIVTFPTAAETKLRLSSDIFSRNLSEAAGSLTGLYTYDAAPKALKSGNQISLFNIDLGANANTKTGAEASAGAATTAEGKTTPKVQTQTEGTTQTAQHKAPTVATVLGTYYMRHYAEIKTQEIYGNLYSGMIGDVEQVAKDTGYMSAYGTVKEYETAQQKQQEYLEQHPDVAAAVANLEATGNTGLNINDEKDAATIDSLADYWGLEPVISEKQYNEAKAVVDNVEGKLNKAHDIVTRNGYEGSMGSPVLSAMQFVVDNYAATPTRDYSTSSSPYDLAILSGYTEEEAKQYSAAAESSLTKEKETLNTVKEVLSDAKGAEQYINNINRRIEIIDESLQGIEYSKIREKEDFHQVATDTYLAVAKEHSVLNDEESRILSDAENVQAFVDNIDSIFDTIADRGVEQLPEKYQKIYYYYLPNELTTRRYGAQTGVESWNDYVAEVKQYLTDELQKTAGGYSASEGERILFKNLDATQNEHADVMSYVTTAEWMTQDEKDTFAYIYGTEGEEKALEYIQLLDNGYGAVSVRRSAGMNALAHEVGSTEGNLVRNALYNVLASFANVTGGISSFAYSVGSAITGNEISPYSSAYILQNTAGAFRQGQKEQIEAGFTGKVGGVVYDVATNFMDNTIRTLLSGGFGAAGATKIGTLAGQEITAAAVNSYALMFTASAGAATQQARLQGADDTRALLYGFACGTAEVVTEVYEVGNLIDIAQGAKKGFKDALVDALSEFCGESASEILSHVADTTILQEYSSYEQRIAELSKTMDESEARKQASREFWGDVLYAGFIGALSSAGQSAYSQLNEGKQQKQQRNLTLERAYQAAIANEINAETTAQQETPVQQQETPKQETNVQVEIPVQEIAGQQTSETVEQADATVETTQEASEQPAEAPEIVSPQSGEETVEQRTNPVEMPENAENGDVENTDVAEIATAPAQTAPAMQTPDMSGIIAARVQTALNMAADTRSTAASNIALAGVMGFDSNGNAASAAADILSEAYENAPDALLTATQAAQDAGIETEEFLQAVRDSVLSGNMAALDPVMSDTVDTNTVFEFYEQALENATDPIVQENIEKTIEDNQIAARTVEILADNAPAIQAAEKAAEKARDKVVEARENAETANDKLDNAAEAVQRAQAQVNENPSDVNIAEAVRSIDQHTAAKARAEAAEKELAKAQTAYTEEANALAKTQQDALQVAREQAKAEMEQQKAAEAQRKALDAQKQALYNQNMEADANGGNYSGQLSSTSERADGRTDNGVSGQGNGSNIQSYDRLEPGSLTDNAQGTMVSTGAVAAANGQGHSGISGQFISKAGRDNLSDKGVTDLHLESSDANLQRFSHALDEGKAGNPRGAFVDAQSVESLREKGAKTFLSSDGMAGVAVGTKGEENGNIFAVFKNSNSTAKKASAELVITAIANGGNKLDNFDGNLSVFYSRLGFTPVARVPFNTDYMPSGWNLEAFGKPDVVFWMHSGDSADTVAQNYENNVYREVTAADIQALPVFDGENGYSEAWAYRDSLLAQQNAESKAGANPIQAYRGKGKPSTQPVAPNNAQPTGTPQRSPAEIAKKLADDLKIGYSVGTRKIRQMPAAVQGIYETRARQIAIRSKQAGSYVTTMHEAFHGLSERLNMTGTEQMVNNLDPAFAENYTAEELPGEAFAEFGWRYMQDDQMARAFAGDAFVDNFERAIRKEGIADAVHKAASDTRMWLNATTNERIGAVIHDQSETRDNRSWVQRIRDATAQKVDDTAASEGVASEVRKQKGKKAVLTLEEDIRSNALMKNFSDRQAWYLLTGKGQTDVGESLASGFERVGMTAKSEDLLFRYVLAKHSLDRDAQSKPVFDENITTDARLAFIADIEANHPEVVAGAEVLQDFRKRAFQYLLVDSGRMTQGEFDALNKMYPNYMPTMRVKENGVSGKRGNKTQRIFKMYAAKGSTEDIINPMDSFVTMVSNLVSWNNANKAALAWDNVYNTYKGMGWFGTEVAKVDPNARVKDVQSQVDSILRGNTSDDVLQDVLNVLNTHAGLNPSLGAGTSPNLLEVQRPDGTRVYYEMHDPELFKLLTSQREITSNNGLLKKIGGLTRFMSKLTTSSNPLFSPGNLMKDFANSVNYGSYASNYFTGALKWLRASYDVWTQGGEYEDYVRLGGGGWTRIEAGTKKGMEDYRSALFKGHETQGAVKKAKWAGKKLANAVTLERLNEVVEQTTRYTEYKYGKHGQRTGLLKYEKTTEADKTKAFLAAQDVTVDFARTGNSAFVSQLKQVIPFFSASLQGIYRTGRMFTETERSRLPARFAKTVINTGLSAALAVGMLKKFLDDDEKEAYELMNDDLKAKYLYIPNFAPSVFGDAPLIRIPLAQDPLTYIVNGAVTNALWGGTTDDGLAIEFGAIAEAVLDNLNPIGSTIFDPIISTMTNENWYGSKIVPTRLEELDETDQFTDDTPDIFRQLGRAFNVSPMMLQYLAEQYTGFIGQLAIPALSKDYSGANGGISAMIAVIQKKFTTDPWKSTSVVNSFYDGYNLLSEFKKAATNGRPANMLKRGLTAQEGTDAYKEATAMLSKGGIVYEAKEAITKGYANIEEIEKRTDLTDEQKYQLTTAERKKMMEAAMTAQEEIGAWKEKYVNGQNIVTNALIEGITVHIPTAYEEMDDTFKQDADAGEDYMAKATEVWEQSGDDSTLPHPKESFVSDGQTLTVKKEYWAQYCSDYKDAYQDYLAGVTGWEDMKPEVKVETLKKAHSYAHGEAKEWCLKTEAYDITE